MARGAEKQGEESGRGRDSLAPTGIPPRGWRDIAIRTWNESSADNIGLIAAGVAFYGFLALVPMLGAFVLSYSLIADPDTVMRHVSGLFILLPSDAARLIGAELILLTEQSAGKTGLGLLASFALSLYGAMRGAGAIITALNISYDEEDQRGFIRTTFLSLIVTVGALVVGLLAVLAIAALALLESLYPYAPQAVLLLVRCAFWGVAAAAASAGIATLYRYGPDRGIAKWRWLTPGAIIATLGWVAMTLAFGFYTANFANYDATYGALGAVVGLLMWLYLSAYILILGAELNSEIEHQTARDSTRGPDQPMGQRDAYVADTIGEVP